MKCTKCNSFDIVKNGFKKLKDKKVQKYKCNECQKYFTGQEKFHNLTEEQKKLILELNNQNIKYHIIAKEVGVYLRSVQFFLEKNLKESDKN